jgi:hypothetical protein
MIPENFEMQSTTSKDNQATTSLGLEEIATLNNLEEYLSWTVDKLDKTVNLLQRNEVQKRPHLEALSTQKLRQKVYLVKGRTSPPPNAIALLPSRKDVVMELVDSFKKRRTYLANLIVSEESLVELAKLMRKSGSRNPDFTIPSLQGRLKSLLDHDERLAISSPKTAAALSLTKMVQTGINPFGSD